MIILDEPYISEYLIQTIKRNDFTVLRNNMSESLGIKSVSKLDAISKYNNNHPLIYTNSENSIGRIIKDFNNTAIPFYIEVFKNKVKFRNLLKKVYPDFFFEEISYLKLKDLDADKINYPFVIKPAIGFLSMGVYIVNNKEEWINTLSMLESDMAKFNDKFPKEVMDSNKFILEEYIEGEEYAIDAYYDATGEPVILNIYKHPFEAADDVKDRIYYTSSDIIQSNLEDFTRVLEVLGECIELKNFPMHIEMRKSADKIIPIEVNPMRFAGWCTCDLAYHAYKINPYECYMKSIKPQFSFEDESLYYFLMAEVPNNINTDNIKAFNYQKFLKNISSPLEVRKYNYKEKPLFAVVFGKTNSTDEINELLKLSVENFIE